MNKPVEIISRDTVQRQAIDSGGIDFLRDLVRTMNEVDESFLDRFSVEQLIAIREAWLASDWDYYPDQWSKAQVRAALAGWVPNFNDEGKPIPSTKRILKRAPR